MNIEEARQYCMSKMGATESFPFDETILVFKIEGKIFALLDLENSTWLMLKCNPERAIELREGSSFIKPAWHMNKKYWNQLDFKFINDDLVIELINHSYEEVLKKLPKSIKDKYITKY